MARCIQLARNGFYGAAPNPMVGAVIVHQEKIIGEGYHIRCGEAHAEVNAIHSVRNPELLKDSTIYVSLEPCSHYGKTPPCADLIIEKGIPRVVVGCTDPFAQVSGRGIRKLRDVGIEVTVGVLEKECLALNRRFIRFHLYRRPYITLKWAESSDGYMDRMRTDFRIEKPYAFSTPYTQMLVHGVRAGQQAILVGRQTALADDPSLINRLWPGRSPLRLVIDREGTLSSGLKLFNGEEKTRVYVDIQSKPAYEKQEKVNCIRLDFSRNVLPQILDDLYRLSVQTLLVEGGACLLKSFIADGLWDEIRIEQSDVLLKEGVPAPVKPCGRMREMLSDGNRLIHILSSATDEILVGMNT